MSLIENPSECIKCHDKARKNGKTAAGSQRYRCDKCKTSWTDSSNIQGSSPIGNQPMTGRVRVKRHRYRQQMMEIAMNKIYTVQSKNTKKFYLHVDSNESRWGFYLTDGDSVWDGGLGLGNDEYYPVERTIKKLEKAHKLINSGRYQPDFSKYQLVNLYPD